MLAAPNGTIMETVTFSATGLPSGTTATFTPPSVAAGNAGTNVMLAIATTPHSSSSIFGFHHDMRLNAMPLYGTALAIGVIWFLFWKGRGGVRPLAPLFLMISLAAIGGGLTGCGSGGGYSGGQVNPATGTPAGNYTITVNAASGNIKVSTTVTLMVM
jgi:hypothetical protein